MASAQNLASDAHEEPNASYWGAIWSMAFSVGVIITTELLPVSLLPAIASDLKISEGLAGQMVSVTSLFAALGGLFSAALFKGVDRRKLMLGFSVLSLISSSLAALSDQLWLILLGRVMLGWALGSFWSISASLSMRLVPAEDLPKALSIVTGAVSIALVGAAPMGSVLETLIGWRGTFAVTAGLSLIGIVWQFRMTPSMPSRARPSLFATVKTLSVPGVPVAMIALMGIFAGQLAFFTYVRPYLEQTTKLDPHSVSLVLLGFGLGTVIGTAISSFAISRSLAMTLVMPPLVIAVVTASLSLLGETPILAGALIAIGGLAFGFIPVGWQTWLTRHVGDDVESGGGLQVASIQIANTIGAGAGGILIDLFSANGPPAFAAIVMAFGGVLVALAVRKS